MHNKETVQKQMVADTFTKVSDIYETNGPMYFTYYGKKLIELAELPEGAHVLDIACGSGAVLLPAAKMTGESGLVTGIDISEGMVARISEEIHSMGLTNVKVLQMDAESLDFPDASFDFITCGFAVFFFPQLQAALEEMKRVLKPEGRICISTFGKCRESDIVNEIFLRYFPPSQPEEGTPPPPDFNTAEGMKEILKAAGLRIIDIAVEDYDAVFKDEEDWWQKQYTTASRRGLERLEAAGQLESCRAEIFETLGKLRKQDGIHFYMKALLSYCTK